MFICAAIYVAAPFLPYEAEDKGVHDGLLGIMLSAFSIAGFVMGPFVGAVFNKFGRRRVILASNLMQAFASVGLALLHYINVEWFFIFMFVVFRILSGISCTIS